MLFDIDENLVMHGIEFSRCDFNNIRTLRKYYSKSQYTDITSNQCAPYFLDNKIYYCIYKNHLCVVNVSSKNRINLMNVPIDIKGKISYDVGFELLRIVNSDFSNTNDCILCTNDEYTRKHIDTNVYHLKNNKKELGYVYDCYALSKMDGSEYKNIRNKHNKFVNKYNFEVIPYDVKMYNIAMGIYEEWYADAKARYDAKDKIWDRYLFERLMKNHNKISDIYKVYVMYDKDIKEYIGLMDFFIINDNLASGVFRKLRMNYVGLAQYFQVYLAKELTKINCQYLNDGEDGGDANLATLKERFHPCFTYKPCDITLNIKKKKEVIE